MTSHSQKKSEQRQLTLRTRAHGTELHTLTRTLDKDEYMGKEEEEDVGDRSPTQE